MGLFSKHSDEHANEAPVHQTTSVPPPQAPAEEPPRRHNSIFHRNKDTTAAPHRDTSPNAMHQQHPQQHQHQHQHQRHDSASSSDNSVPSSPNGGRQGRSLLQRSGGNHNNQDIEMDPSIVRARERVMHAESAEREADRVLAEARSAVNDARIEVKRLEEEAAEEARRAKIKAFHVKDISKRGNSLGRHLNL
jgi:hypothetical protein